MSRSPYYIKEDIFEHVGDSVWKTSKPPSYAIPSTGTSWLPQVSDVPRRNIRVDDSLGRANYVPASTWRDKDESNHRTKGQVNITKEVKWNDDVTASVSAQTRVEETYVYKARRPHTPYHLGRPSEKVLNPWETENQKKYNNAVNNVNKKYMNEVRRSPSSPADMLFAGKDRIDEKTCQAQGRIMRNMVNEREKMVTQTNDIDVSDTHVQFLPKPPSEHKERRGKKKSRRHNKKKISDSNEDTIENGHTSNNNRESVRSITFQPHPPTAPNPKTIHIKPHPPTASKPTIHSVKPHPPTAPKPTIRSFKPHPPTAPKPVLPDISRHPYKPTEESLNTPISEEEEERRFKQEQDKLRFNLRVTRKIMEENNASNGALNAEARKKWKHSIFYD